MAVRNIKNDFKTSPLINNKKQAISEYKDIFNSQRSYHNSRIHDVLHQAKESYAVDLKSLPEGIAAIQEFNSTISQHKALQEQFLQTIQNGHIYDSSNIVKDIIKIIIVSWICILLYNVSAPTILFIVGFIIIFVSGFDLIKRCTDYDGTYKKLQQLYIEIDELDTKLQFPLNKLHNIAVQQWSNK